MIVFMIHTEQIGNFIQVYKQNKFRETNKEFSKIKIG